MEAKFRIHVLKYSLLSLLSLALLIPYTSLIYKSAYLLAAFHAWPVWYIALPGLWVFLITLYKIIKDKGEEKNSDYKKITAKSNLSELSPSEIYAKTKLDNLFTTISSKIGKSFKLNYLVYQNRYGKNENSQHNVIVKVGKKDISIQISQKSIELLDDQELLGVLSHEIGHVMSARWMVISQIIKYILAIPITIITLFVTVSIGFISWWYFFPAMILLGLVNTYVLGLPFLIMELCCDKLAVMIGYGAGLAEYLENIPNSMKNLDGIHLHPETRIKLIEKWQED